MNIAAVEFNRVCCRLGGAAVLRDLDLSAAPGETVVLLGRSGCGKTTALKLVNRLLTPSEGQVLVQGRATTDWDHIRLRRRIGYVIQETGLFPHYTVRENVALVPSLEKWDAEKAGRRVAEMLDLVGLNFEQFADRYPDQLSGGQRQRVGVARALAADPPILLMDEPFGALDPVTRGEIQSEFKTLQKRLGKTILFVTHDLVEACLLGDRIALLEGGRLTFCGSRQQLLQSPLPAVQSFLAPLKDSLRGGFADASGGGA